MSNVLKRIMTLSVVFCVLLLLPNIYVLSVEEEPQERYWEAVLKSKSEEDGWDYISTYENLALGLKNMNITEIGASVKITLDSPYEASKNIGKELKIITEACIADYPEYFWAGEYNGYTPGETGATKVSINPIAYNNNVEAFELAAENLIASAGVSSDMSEYEKAKAIYDELIETVEYEEGEKNSSNAYNAIVEKVADSKGYAKAYQYLLYKVGIQAGTVSGTVKSTGKERTWNFVRIDGKYYYSDPASDDGGAVPLYKYFNITTIQIEEERTITPFSYGEPPLCASTEAAYKGDASVHTHVFDKEVQKEEYIKYLNCGENIVYYKSCSCGEASETETFSSETIAEHVFTSYRYNGDAKCGVEGTETAVCSRCGAEDTRTAEGTELEHRYEKEAIKEPTCTEEGYTVYKCSNDGCGAFYVGDETEKTTHSGGTATCEKRAVCEVCKTEYGNLAEHEYDMSRVFEGDSTGHWYNCKNCSAHTEPKEHIPGPEATELNPQVCAVCGYILKPSLEHEHRLTLVPAVTSTCTERGNIAYYVCSCGHWFMDINAENEIVLKENVLLDLKEHSFTNYISDGNATCANDGTETAKCDYCSATNTRTEENSRLRHSYIAAITEPSCTAGGFTRYTCEYCFDTYVSDETDALGHSWKEATCTAPETCERCGAENGSAYGHIYSEWISDDTEHWKMCLRENCGEKIYRTTGTHSDWNYDGVCDICDHSLPEMYSITPENNGVIENINTESFLIKTDKNTEKLTNIMIDGETVMKMHYTVVSEDSLISFSSEFLKTLELGEHMVKFIYVDGTASATFTIINSVAPPEINTETVVKKTEVRTIEIEIENEEVNPNTGSPAMGKGVLIGAAVLAVNV